MIDKLMNAIQQNFITEINIRCNNGPKDRINPLCQVWDRRDNVFND